MHVALVTHYYPPEDGAPQRRWGAFVERFVAAGHRVTVLAPPPHYPTGRLDDDRPEHRPGTTSTGPHGETIHRLHFRTHGDGLVGRTADQCVTAADAFGRGSRLLREARDRPDVIIATVPGIPSIGAGIGLSLTLRAPVVVEMRDAWPDLIAPSGIWGTTSRGWRPRVTHAAHRAITRQQHRAAAVVTTTAAFADVMRSRGMRNVETIRNGASVGHVPLLRAPDVRADQLRAVYIGTMGRSQGLGTAVRAAALLRDRGVGIRLRLVGSGADEQYLRAEASRTDAPVDFVGRVPRDDVPAHYSWADTAIVSLRDWEPFEWTVPSKLYEILAVGRHVTAAAVGETAHVVDESRAGDVVAPQSVEALADLWSRLARDRRRLDVGGHGRLWVSEHADHDALAARYLELLEGVRT